MSKAMRRDAFRFQRRTVATGDCEVLVEQVFQAIVAQRRAPCRGKDRIGWLALTFAQPSAQHCDCVFSQRGAALFAA
jgi:hypothetical protein